MGRPRPVMVVLVVSTFVEAVGDAPLLALRSVVLALVIAGGAMGGGASDGPRSCAGSDADSVGAVPAVIWTLVVEFGGVDGGGAVGFFPGVGDTDGGSA